MDHRACYSGHGMLGGDQFYFSSNTKASLQHKDVQNAENVKVNIRNQRRTLTEYSVTCLIILYKENYKMKNSNRPQNLTRPKAINLL